MLLAKSRVEEKKLKEKREKAEVQVRAHLQLGDPQQKPHIGRPKKVKEAPIVLGKRKRAKKPVPKRKKAKKGKPAPKNQPSIASIFAKK